MSDTPEKLIQLNTHLKGSDDALKRSLPVLNDQLALLDPAQYTLGWLYILYVAPYCHTLFRLVCVCCLVAKARAPQMRPC
jgi:hypothetical protein